ncbi:MAG: helix-turn-helix transcriptional regulator [Actinocatenispora sp.]
MSPLKRELSPSSSLPAYFGWRLRHWRQQRRLTQAELGRQIGYDHSHISKVEIGERCPPRELAALCDERLDTNGELTALWPLLARNQGAEQDDVAPAADPTALDPGHAPMVKAVPDTAYPAGPSPSARPSAGPPPAAPPLPAVAGPGFPTVAGSSVLQATPLALVAGLFPHAGLPTGPEHAGVPTEETLHALGALFTAYEAASNTMEPSVIIPPLEHQLRQLLTWRAQVDRRYDVPLLELAARHAGLLGWLWFERIAHVDAIAWFEWGCGWARAAGNHELASELNTMQAAVACWERDSTTTIDLARAAQTGPRLGPRVRALAMLAEARGEAMNGAFQDSTRLLGEAGGLFADGGASSEPVWLSPKEATKRLGVAEGTVSLELAVSLGRTDLGRQAVDKLTDSLRLDDVDGQHTLLVRSRLADAYAYTGDPEAAADMMLVALRTADTVRSPRLRHELRAVRNRLVSRWPDLPAITTMDQAVHEALPVGPTPAPPPDPA